MTLQNILLQALALLKLRESNRGVSACYYDNDNPSDVVKLKFMNDIPSPPPYLNMRISLKYYDITNSSLVNEEQETYNLVLGGCESKETFAFSYGNTNGMKLVIKRHRHRNQTADIGRYNNTNATSICYVTVYHGRTFILRLAFNSSSKRPTYPIIEVSITLSNDSNFDINPFYNYTLVGWQIKCKKRNRYAVIDNPIFVFDDWPKIKILDIYAKFETKATYAIKDNRKTLLRNMSSFDVENLKAYRFTNFTTHILTNSTMNEYQFNNLRFFYSDVTYYECIVHNTKSTLFEYQYQGFLLETVFFREEFVGINNSIQTQVTNEPEYIDECKENFYS
ncbi:hypothetical protein RF11_06463 [Thelohanellus kitauei]|uniref:Uncharacterized protein n=1 Tax=Thelohanellus kitauei TaxID=669202 RepID=A0A0C2MAF3_THEKT|nr:hypothetical protein RF11_06463 [Thelohanellus kitauei]